MPNKLQVEYVSIDEIKTYENNAKLHPAEQVEQIKESIKEFGFNDPIAIDKDNIIIEGHGRYIACKELGITEVPIIRLNELSDEQKRAYMLVHNKLTMNTDFDIELLNDELENIFDIDMSKFDFNINPLEDDEEESKYTSKIDIPQYQITGEKPSIDELVDTTKTDELIEEINNTDLPDKEKQFLINSAYRHLTFNYSKIAEWYAHQNKDVQELMEKSALVIIDFDDAMKNGYIELSSRLEQIIDRERTGDND